MQKYFETAARLLIISIFGFVIIGEAIIDSGPTVPLWWFGVSLLVIIIFLMLRPTTQLLKEVVSLLPEKIRNLVGIFILLVFGIGIIITILSALSLIQWA